MDERLSRLLRDRTIDEELIDAVLDSGYYVRDWVDPVSGRMYASVSDGMYGSKQFSSNFEIDGFVRYLRGENAFESLPPFNEVTVRTHDELLAVLAEPRRKRYIAEGSLSFRGQPQEFKLKRRVPNPRRSDRDGFELSILPALYRQTSALYSFAPPVDELKPWALLLHELEPNTRNPMLDGAFAYDIMRTEQHYATATQGLDVSFDIGTALFFATYRFRSNDNDTATYTKVKPGDHQGVIYCFRFEAPSVTETEFLIQDFDFFKTNRPERILRQRCGLPLFGGHERNIAITDIDCIIRLAPDFAFESPARPEHLFPDVSQDEFYRVLLALKDRYPEALRTVVEYEWARNAGRD
jgi:hypothetical protein